MNPNQTDFEAGLNFVVGVDDAAVAVVAVEVQVIASFAASSLFVVVVVRNYFVNKS